MLGSPQLGYLEVMRNKYHFLNLPSSMIPPDGNAVGVDCGVLLFNLTILSSKKLW